MRPPVSWRVFIGRRAHSANRAFVRLRDGTFHTYLVPGSVDTCFFNINERGDLVGRYIADGVEHGLYVERLGRRPRVNSSEYAMFQTQSLVAASGRGPRNGRDRNAESVVFALPVSPSGYTGLELPAAVSGGGFRRRPS